MAALKKRKLPSFLVIPDSNILFTEKPADLIRPSFKPALDHLCNLAKVTLHIPHVVAEERLFQVFRTAQMSCERARESQRDDVLEKVLVAGKPFL